MSDNGNNREGSCDGCGVLLRRFEPHVAGRPDDSSTLFSRRRSLIDLTQTSVIGRRPRRLLSIGPHAYRVSLT
jgi:hypothetical protein